MEKDTEKKTELEMQMELADKAKEVVRLLEPLDWSEKDAVMNIARILISKAEYKKLESKCDR